MRTFWASLTKLGLTLHIRKLSPAAAPTCLGQSKHAVETAPSGPGPLWSFGSVGGGPEKRHELFHAIPVLLGLEKVGCQDPQ